MVSIVNTGVINTNEELVELIQKGVDVQRNLEVLYERNKNYIYKITIPFMKYAEADDLLQEAYIGFQKAVFSYVPGDAKLTTYATWKIRQQCIRYIENFSNIKRIPSSTLNFVRKYKLFIKNYQTEHGAEPEDSTIIKELDLSQDKLKYIRRIIYEQHCISVNSDVADSDELTIEDSVADEFDLEAEVEDKLFREHERKVLDDAIHTLKPNEEKVICSRYWNEHSQKRIASDMGISHSRVSAIEKEALKKLRKNDSIQELIEEKYGYDSHNAYHMSVMCCLNNHTSSTEQTAIKRIMLNEKQLKIQSELDKIFKLNNVFARN